MDAETDSASNTRNFLSASNTCNQLNWMYACINYYFYIVIDCTANTLFAGNNAASNTCKLFGYIQYFVYCLLCLLANSINGIQKGRNMQHKLRKFWNQFGFRDFNFDAIWIWRIWLFCYPGCELGHFVFSPVFPFLKPNAKIQCLVILTILYSWQ